MERLLNLHYSRRFRCSEGRGMVAFGMDPGRSGYIDEVEQFQFFRQPRVFLLLYSI
jgi:hypothetical protein